MNINSILNYNYLKLKTKLDSSEYYDVELSNEKNISIIDMNVSLDFSDVVIDNNCFDNFTTPITLPVNQEATIDGCEFFIKNRTELGWTINIVFNRNDLTPNNGVFYYLGIENEVNESFYLDNNLSFSFSENNEVFWRTIKYDPICDTTSGFTDNSIIVSGKTEPICVSGLTNDFNITITFRRNSFYNDCDLLNEGGINDLITGSTLINDINEVINSQEEEIYENTYVLNEKWFNEKFKRMGVLKIYFNANPIYTNKEFEEIIPSIRQSENNIVQIWGSGTTGIENLHNSNTNLQIKDIKYFEKPLTFLEIKNLFLTQIKNNFNISECINPCTDIFN